MKTLTSSVAFQDETGNILANGSLIFTLPPGLYLAAGGGQLFGQSAIINLNNLAKIPSATQIWASDEISPQTPYSVTLCRSADGLGPVGSATWFISGSSPIDLSLMVSSSSTGISLLEPGLTKSCCAAEHQCANS